MYNQVVGTGRIGVIGGDRSYLVVARQAAAVSNRPVRVDVASALGEWRLHLAALAVVAAAFVAAAAVGSTVAYYAAALVSFSVWMAWFVMMAVDVLRGADF